MAKLIESITRPLQVKDNKTLTGEFAITDTFNQNGRRYPESIYAKAYQELLPKIRERRLLGELDHPSDRDEVFLSNVSHVVTECHTTVNQAGKKVYSGTVELLDTPAGKIAQALAKAGIPLGISSRGIGNTRKVPEGVEVTQLKLITYDLVAEPSFKSSVLTPERKSELSESLSTIESKIPLNESIENDSLRKRINNIRESLRLTESGVNNRTSQELQTMELNTLKSLVASKSQTIKSDTKLLKETRQQIVKDKKKIRELEEDLNKVKSQYTNIREHHHTLQDEYNRLQESYKDEVDRVLEEKDVQVAELLKRLAVEKRGMSYTSVRTLLEGLRTEEEIEARLDTLSTMSRKSSTLTESYVETVKEKLVNTPRERNPLSKIIARV